MVTGQFRGVNSQVPLNTSAMVVVYHPAPAVRVGNPPTKGLDRVSESSPCPLYCSSPPLPKIMPNLEDHPRTSNWLGSQPTKGDLL